MSEDLWAAREGDALLHTSVMADILGGVLEVAAYAALTTVGCLAVAGAVFIATGATIATGGVALVLVVGAVVGITAGLTGADLKISSWCESAANWVFPPVIDAFITSGSHNVFINGKKAARAAGKMTAVPVAPSEPPAPSFLDMAGEFFSQMWRPTVASPAPGTEPCPLDTVACNKHPPMPLQFIAEGSSSVFINGQPAARSGDRSTCDAKIGTAEGLISPDVRIGGETIVVQEIRSGKTPGVGLAIAVVMALRGNLKCFWTKLPCMIGGALVGGAIAYGTAKVTSALKSAMNGSPNPVHSATGAKVLGGEEELDFILPGLLNIVWQRFYSSLDTRQGSLFGAGWSVGYEVAVEIDADENLTYIDEQGRRLEIGYIPLSGGAFSPGEGLAVRRSAEGAVLIESTEGLYRLFETDPLNSARMRLHLLGDRNEGRIFLDYDAQGRLCRLRDTHDLMHVDLIYTVEHPGRVSHIERRYLRQDHFNARSDVLVSYRYDSNGDLAEVLDAQSTTQRRFAYDASRRLVEHQLPSGLRCFYQWAEVEGPGGPEWRVSRHWTDAGDEYTFEYDLDAGITRVTDGLMRVSTRHWNPQFQITRYVNNLGYIWQFEWSDDRQLLAAIDPQGGQWSFNYDESGNLSAVIDPLGRTSGTRWLAHWALPEVETDTAGHSWHYRYDQRGNCIEEVDPLGNRTRYVYDGFGQPVRIFDATEKARTLHWNEWSQLVEEVDCSGYPTRYQYDAFGNLVVQTNAEGESVRYRYSPQGLLLECQLPDGRVEQLQRSTSGYLTAYIDPAGSTTRYAYDVRGLVKQRWDAHNRTIMFDHDAYGRLCRLTNENGESYRFEWDAADRLVQQQDLDQSRRCYTYDQLDDVIAVDYLPGIEGEPVAPLSHQFQRDPLGRLISKVTSDGTTVYEHDLNDQLVGVSFTALDGRQQALGFSYDALGQLLEEQSAAGSVRHRYDELGNLIQTGLPDGRWLNRLYYGSGHLHQLNIDGKVISDFERDRVHREVQRTQGQFKTSTAYDRSGRVRSRQRRSIDQPWQLPPVVETDYTYDPSDNLIGRRRISRQYDRQELMGYDSTGRVLVSHSMGRSETYAYDAAANLLDAPQQSGLVRYNRLLTHQDKRYKYDTLGRMVEKRSAARGLQRFAYDAESRLVEVRNENGSIVRMTYDPLGRRIEKSEHGANDYPLGRSSFTWDGLQLLQEQRNNQSSVYVYEEGDYAPLARIDGLGVLQSIRYYHNDIIGLPEQLTETDGHIVWQAKYRVWGNTVEEISEPYFLEQQNLRFQGQYLDREIGLHYNIFRFYDPDVGRFTTTDPIGLAGGFNLYQYAANPIGWLDPWGLSACAPTHHIATNKHAKWTPKYRVLFEKNGLGKFKNGKSRRDVLNDPLNKVDVPGHKGPHPDGMHAEIYKRLQNASRKGPDQFKAELAELRKEALDPTSTLNKILRKVDL
ncbi:RHS domain-containing protein [Pseudomonas paralactis]|uniref:RHS domain-containing protein n=1 Tax=Pseudomonas paralactis TaxID=1615673 RepID=A0ABS0V1B7_9PSED|nr:MULTISPECIES: RHS repeat-associated core domain-containing protein [Pseudomonas]MBI6632759.1 RHS domain-containing protein [Pseudomonas paralactis]MBJ2218165.1 RHS domain-containing protein [Pseudomonas sp. MF7453]